MRKTRVTPSLGLASKFKNCNEVEGTVWLIPPERVLTILLDLIQNVIQLSEFLSIKKTLRTLNVTYTYVLVNFQI